MAKDYSNEKWLPVIGFEGLYEVSNMGRVMQIERPKGGKLSHLKMPTKLKKLCKHRHGYYTVTLCTNKRFLVHRLVATAFIPNPNNLPAINHKNLKKHDNTLDNLEWCTYSENTQHYLKHPNAKIKSRKKKKAIREYVLKTCMGINAYMGDKFIGYYESAPICAKKLKLKSYSNIYQVINGNITQYRGYRFEKVDKAKQALNNIS